MRIPILHLLYTDLHMQICIPGRQEPSGFLNIVSLKQQIVSFETNWFEHELAIDTLFISQFHDLERTEIS